MTAPPPPSPATVAVLSDAALLSRWRRRGDLTARDALVARHLPRARRVAAQHWRRTEPLDDLEQVASIGLMKALERFDPSHGAALWTFALPTIAGELKRHYRDNCSAIRVPRPLRERAALVQRALAAATAELGRSPTARELAERTRLAREDVVEALEALSASDPRSLDEALSSFGNGSATVGDLVGADDGRLESAERRAAMAPALRTLPKRERAILHLRFEEDLTQSEIAERLGISQMHVSRLLRSALASLRESLGAPDAVASA